MMHFDRITSQTLVRLMIVLAALMLAGFACQLGPSVEEGAQSGEVLFQDDFSNPRSGWDRVVETNGEANYQDGVYRIFVNTPNTDIMSNPGIRLSDVVIETDATKVGGPDDNDFGVICRMSDKSHFYFFLISSDGYFGVGKITPVGQELIEQEAMLPSEAIARGAASNHLRAECVGDTLRFFVNGEKLSEVQDTEYARGDVGLMAGTFGTFGTDIIFDNFSVTKP